MEFILQTFQGYHIIVLFLGLLLGIIVGALPGLTPTMGVALMIPFTFSMGPTEGLIVLGGIYCGSVYGGSIPAILFNVPGAPASVATTFDGYPLTKKGEARKALEIGTIASVIGGLVGMCLLLFFAPLVADFSLQFGPSENFWIAIFGLTVIAAISDGSVIKNLIGGCFGLLLSFIGIHTITGTARFTFGIDSLVGGLNVVAVLIGLFAFPQALKLIEQLSSVNKEQPLIYKIKKSTIKESLLGIIKKPKSVAIGSTVGAFIGMIPGAGGNIASILAYNEVKRFSKEKDTFGKGNQNGVIASESANNAMVGGSLIPLLTLGIPGSPTAAIFLGGLLIHGIWPGRSLFVDNADVAHTFIYSMVASQLLLLFLGLALIKYMTKLSQIPAYIMAPVILSFSIIGAYTMQNSVFDVYTVVTLGLIMFALSKWNFAAAPVALGFILGPIAEEGLLQGLQVGRAQGEPLMYFFTGTINTILYALIVATVLISIFQAFKKRRKEKSFLLEFSVNRFASKQVFAWLLFGILNIYLLLVTNQLPFEHKLFPQIAFFILLILAILGLTQTLFQEGYKQEKKQSVILSQLPLILLVSFICLLISYLGFYLQILILLIIVPVYLIVVNKNKDISLKKVVWISLLFTIIMFIIFSIIVKVPLPVPFMM